jgi:IS5 family transposase
MARRRIGQEELLARAEPRSGGSLQRLAAMIDWTPVDRCLADISASVRGERGWPPMALFRALLLATWHDLSDVRLAEALDDRASFRRFCGFAAHEPTPERTAFVRFRRELVRRELDKALFEEVTGQLRAKAVTVKTGTLIDATLIASASHADGEAAWAGHQRRKAVHGFKAHVGADADTALVESLTVTPGNVHDGRAGGAALPENPGEVFADSAYRGEVFGSAVRARGGTPRIVATGMWGGPGDDTERKLRRWNYAIQRVRCRIEKIFGTWKRSYGLRRMRWRGLAKAGLQVRITAIAYNLRRAVTLLWPVAA